MVRVEHLYKSYGSVPALRDVSFRVKEGELFGVIGPDGAGKTSLFRILTSLILPDSFDLLELDGLHVVNDFREIRGRVGYMPGRFSLYSDLTVEENLEFFATVFGTTIKENYQLIRDIYKQIEPFKDRFAGKLSGGMKQKLALSCALIHQPRVLILDEPTTGVDAVSRREFWELLLGLKARGITIIVSTPYMDEAMMCDRVSLIQKGQILETDTPVGIEASFGRKLFAVGGDNKYRLLVDLRSFDSTDSVFPFGQETHITLKREGEELDALQHYLTGKGHTDCTIKSVRPTIEDVFMKLMIETYGKET